MLYIAGRHNNQKYKKTISCMYMYITDQPISIVFLMCFKLKVKMNWFSMVIDHIQQ